MARSRKNKADFARKLIIGGALLVVVGVLAFGVLYSTGVTDSGEIVEGTHYFDLDRPAQYDPIEVAEFFSYECIHCRNFDPIVQEWQTNLPDGVVFVRKHAGFSPRMLMYARAQVALEHHDAFERNHTRIFTAIHDRRKNFTTPAALADYVDGFGVDRAAFLSAFEGRRTAKVVDQSKKQWLTYRLSGVPALVVADKYVINFGHGQARALDTVDALIAKLFAERANPTPDTAAN